MRNIMGSLSKLTDRYYLHCSREENLGETLMLTCHELMQRGMYKNLDKKLIEFEEYFNNENYSFDYFFFNLNYHSIKQNMSLSYKSKLEELNYHKNILNSLFVLFSINFFPQLINMVANSKQYKRNYDLSKELIFAEKFAEYIENADYENKNVILLYYYLFMTKHTNSDNYLNKLIEIFKNLKHRFSNIERFNIYVTIISYYTQKAQEGDKKNYYNCFEWILTMIKDGSHYGYHGKKLMPGLFAKFVTVGCITKNFEWVKEFISTYHKELDESVRDNYLNFYSALLYYHLKNYKLSINHLSLVKYTNAEMKLEVRILQSKIYYEMEDREQLFSLMASFKKFIKNDELSSLSRKQIYGNFVTYLSKIIDVKYNFKNNSILKNLIDRKYTEVKEKEWLLEKIDQIIN